MCAVYAGDGSRHHSAGRAKMHDDMAADKKGAKPAAEPKPKGEAADGGGEKDGEDVSNMPIHEVVAKHGPANKVEIEHDHEGGSHKKTSHHGEKKHVSEHETAEEAHEHGAMAAGVEETPDEEEETPDAANRALAGEEGDRQGVGSSIPGLG